MTHVADGALASHVDRSPTSLETMSDLVERVRQVLPSVRDDLENLVRIQSVWADPADATRCIAVPK